VLSSRVGRGTVFAIEVPRAAAQAATIAVTPEAAPDAPRSRILVVDNDPEVLRAMQALLTGWRCEVLAARNAVDAIAVVATGAPDLLLLDYHLDGGRTGLMLREQLRAVMPDRPCVIITADHSEDVRNEVAAAGCQLLHKPLKPLALKSVMARVLAPRD
jgi:CheY-like chemotaxis protein